MIPEAVKFMVVMFAIYLERVSSSQVSFSVIIAQMLFNI